MICKWCGNSIPASATKCKRCGKAVPTMSDCGGFYDLMPNANNMPADRHAPGVPGVPGVPVGHPQQPAQEPALKKPSLLALIGWKTMLTGKKQIYLRP